MSAPLYSWAIGILGGYVPNRPFHVSSVPPISLGAFSGNLKGRLAGVSFSARALTPGAGDPPPWRGYPAVFHDSSISPVAIRHTCTAHATRSAGRFCPWGPVGIGLPLRGQSRNVAVSPYVVAPLPEVDSGHSL